MIDVFSRYFFTYPTQNVTARLIERCLADVMTRNAHLPTLILSDKGSQFRSEVVAEIIHILGIQISHASPNMHRQSEYWNELMPISKQYAHLKIDRRTTLHIAQIRTNSSHELQYNLS